jgi:hypothetical protein
LFFLFFSPFDDFQGDFLGYAGVSGHFHGEGGHAFAEAERTLVAKVPGRPNKAHFPKEDFHIDLEAGTCTCPAGKVTRRVITATTRIDHSGQACRVKGFHFHGATCRKCQLRDVCVAAGNGKGRTVTLHPQEALLQQARTFQKSEAFGEYRRRRQVSEHRLARLVQLGIRQARYFGRVKTLFQLLMAATVANLTLAATKLGLMGTVNQSSASFFAAFHQGLIIAITTMALRLFVVNAPLLAWSTEGHCSTEGGFRPDF